MPGRRRGGAAAQGRAGARHRRSARRLGPLGRRARLERGRTRRVGECGALLHVRRGELLRRRRDGARGSRQHERKPPPGPLLAGRPRPDPDLHGSVAPAPPAPRQPARSGFALPREGRRHLHQPLAELRGRKRQPVRDARRVLRLPERVLPRRLGDEVDGRRAVAHHGGAHPLERARREGRQMPVRAGRPHGGGRGHQVVPGVGRARHRRHLPQGPGIVRIPEHRHLGADRIPRHGQPPAVRGHLRLHRRRGTAAKRGRYDGLCRDSLQSAEEGEGLRQHLR